MKPFKAFMLRFRITAHIFPCYNSSNLKQMSIFKMKFEQKCSFFKNLLHIFFLVSDMLCMLSFLILFAIFRNRDRLFFFYAPLNSKKWMILNRYQSKYGHLQRIITSIVIYFEIYYTGSLCKYSCKILRLLSTYFFTMNSQN